MKDQPCYPITVYYRDSGEWVKDSVYDNEFDLVVGLEFADTDEQEDSWAIKVEDVNGKEVSLKIDAIELIRFELKSI